jgi:hypothetical protein
LADRTVPIGNLGESDAPLTYTVPPSFSFTLMGVRASFDGGGAAGAFLPCVQLISDSGQIMAQTIGSAVAAGDSADVTFAPFLRGAAAGSGPTNAVLYDVSNQTGGFLDAYTDTGAIDLEDHSGSGFFIASQDPGGTTGGFVSIATADGEVITNSTSIVERLRTGGKYEVQTNGAADLFQIGESGFFAYQLGSGQRFVISDSLGNAILRVDEGGGGAPSYHIKTGGAWVADLP